jgi:hypothetical protein
MTKVCRGDYGSAFYYYVVGDGFILPVVEIVWRLNKVQPCYWQFLFILGKKLPPQTS